MSNPEGPAPEEPARPESSIPHADAAETDTAAPGDAGVPRRRPRSLRLLVRLARGVLLVLLAVLAGAIVGLLVVDPGPALRGRAEREGSRLIDRPIHIGHLSIGVLRGRFVLDDVVIDNLRPDSPPFFSAKRIVVTMPWWTILSRREILLESIVISRWTMLVETYAGGGHNFIKLPKRRDPAGPRRYVTTVKLVRVMDGEFTYRDEGTPWSTVARNLDLTIAKLQGYRGEARFRGGTVQIQRYAPMWANMSCTFDIEGSKVVLDRIDLETDGAHSAITGVVDIGHWPEQIYKVNSRIRLPRMKEIFFAGSNFSLAGEADFDGTFHLFKGGRDLSGRFSSPEAGLNAWRFPGLQGNVRWLPARLEVSNTTSGFYGGRLALTYTMAPLGKPVPALARLETTLKDVDLRQLTDFLDRPVLRLAGRFDNRNVLEWPLGRWREHRGGGEMRARAPESVWVMTRGGAAQPDVEDPMGPFNPAPLQAPLPIGGSLTYRYGPEWVEVADGVFATPRTFVTFDGRTAYGTRSTFPFHVTSADWQESDRVLAAIISAFGSPSRAIPIGGRGEFDGVMTGAFTRPYVTGRFRGDRMRAWDVTWGEISGDVTIFNSYADVRDAHVRSGDAAMDVTGRFSLGYPRRDLGEEIDARIQLRRWPLVDLRHAFELDDYPIEGLVTGEFHIYDKYTAPDGFGRMAIDNLVAYGERFETSQAGLRFEGRGVRLDGIDARIGPGTVTGAAYVGWDGTYSFNADGRGLPVATMNTFAYEQLPKMSGALHFTASGSGAFASPRYELRAGIDDFRIGAEPVGELSGHLLVRDDVLTFDQVEVASPRLAVSARGRVALTPEADGEILLQVHDSSLDPYIRVFRPGFSPSTTVVASGTLSVFGELRNADRVRAQAVIDRVSMNLFDYAVRNDGDIRLSMAQQVLRVDRLRVVGEGTALEVFGDVQIPQRRVALRALGDTDLGLLQGFARDIRSSGAAELQAEVRGSLDAPTIVGALQVTNGRVRHFAFPHSLENINGRLEFDAAGLRIDSLRGRLGGGAVRIDGRLGFRGLSPTEYSINLTGQEMRLRYPEGFRSLVDADLALRGTFFSPLLTGTVTVRNATLERTIDTSGTGVFGVAAVGLPGATGGPRASGIPLRFDIRLLAPSSLKVEHRAARLTASAELTLRGTYDQPVLFGRLEVDHGEVLFEGNRYQVTRGIVDFVNPVHIEPLFDVEAETRVRVPGQVYRVQIRIAGTPERFTPQLSSDPPLAPIDILSLLFGDVRDPQNAEVRALESPQQAEQELLYARAARLLASPISSNVSRVVEEAIGVDTVQITPLVGDLLAQQSARITPSARLTLGKRISARLFLSYSRALNASTRDEIILLEFDQSDRLSWIVSQNEDRTYAIDVRVRHVF